MRWSFSGRSLASSRMASNQQCPICNTDLETCQAGLMAHCPVCNAIAATPDVPKFKPKPEQSNPEPKQKALESVVHGSALARFAAATPLLFPLLVSLHFTLSPNAPSPKAPEDFLAPVWLWCFACVAISIVLLGVGFVAPRANGARILLGFGFSLICNGIPAGIWTWQMLPWNELLAHLPRRQPPLDQPIMEDQWRDFVGPNDRFHIEFPGTPMEREERAPELRDPVRMHVLELGNRAF